MAGLNHSASSNASPNHNQCPHGDNSWCKYNRMLANQEIYIKKRTKGKCSPRMLFQAKDAYPDYEHICTVPDAVVSRGVESGGGRGVAAPPQYEKWGGESMFSPPQ